VVAVVGPQGAGKSTFLQWLYGQIPGAAIALDPHAAKGDHARLSRWSGRGWTMGQLIPQLRRSGVGRGALSSSGTRDTTSFPRLLVVVEELTNWADRVSSAKALIKEALSDFSKANVQLVLVSHGKTNALMGGSEGMAALRQSGMLLLEISEKGKGDADDSRGAPAHSCGVYSAVAISTNQAPLGCRFGWRDRPHHDPAPADTPQVQGDAPSGALS
jgi:ABC-type uncharacterized transport system ATPase subunit